MEKEFNYKENKLALNLFADEDPSQSLSEIIGQTLKVIETKMSALLKHNFSSVEVNLNIVDDERIREINQEYRDKDKATDVLSFPMQENVRRGDYEEFDGHLELGDIFVATGVCARQASENDLTFDQEFAHLFAHGFLHLCGYDHEENEEEDKLMRGLESELMEDLGNLRK